MNKKDHIFYKTLSFNGIMKPKIFCVKKQNPQTSSLSQFVYKMGLVAGSILVIASCQTYTPEPLYLDNHVKEWQKRTPSDRLVRDYARKLSKEQHKPRSFNPSDGISLFEARIIALVYNPDLCVARLREGVATAKAEYAGLWKDPEFGLDILNITDSVPKPWNVSGSLSFTIPLTGRIKTIENAISLEQKIEFTRLEEVELKMSYELTKNWIQWSSLMAELEETRRMEKVIADIIKTTDKIVKIGELKKNEANLLHIDLVNYQVESSKLEGDITTKTQKIKTLLGLSPQTSLKLVPALRTKVKTHSYDAIKQTNPTLKRFRQEYNLAEVKLKQEIQKQFPDLQLGPVFESDQGQSSIGFINGIPLAILNSNKGGIATAKANRKLAQATLETEYERRIGQIFVHKAKLKTLRNLNNEIMRKLIPIIDRQLEETKKLTQIGETNILALIESLTRSHDAKLRMIKLTKEQSITELEIQHLLGAN